jgi:putative acetyltransferase
MKLRAYTEADAETLAALFTASVHELAMAHYDAEQRQAWAPIPPDLSEWRDRFAGLQTIVAEDQDACLGFIAYEPDGHIDLLYTAPDTARKGVASALLQEVIARFSKAGDVMTLFTEASLVAAPFFLRFGFEVSEEQNVLRRGVHFRRFAMRRSLRTSPPEA